MGEPNSPDSAEVSSSNDVRFFVAVAWGALIGGMTFAAGPIGLLSANSIISAVQWVLLILILPGIVGGAVIGGSAHTISLGVGAVVNALLHFGVSWLLFPLLLRLKRTVLH